MKEHRPKQKYISQFRTLVHHYESGQIIILMAFGLVILLAATGLAIDGGRLVYLKRNAQNATDAAILAATYVLCSEQTDATVENTGLVASVEHAALTASAENGFANGIDGVTITISSPPVNNSRADINGNPAYVEISIETETPSYFLQMITGASAIETSAYGVGHCNVPDESQNLAAYEAAVLTFGEGCDTGIDFNGSEGHYSTIIGNLVSNKDIRIVSAGSIEGSILTLAGSTRTGSGTMTATGGESTYSTELLPTPYLFDIYSFAPEGARAEFVINSFGTDYYHYYDSSSKKFNHDTLEGLYYFSENVTDIQFVGVDIGPMGATIVSHHGMQFSATKDARFVSFIDDLLIFSLADQGGDCSTSNGPGSVKMSGYTYWEGLFYAPEGYIDLPGSGVVGNGSAIANDFSSRISEGHITYKADIIPQTTNGLPTIEITQ